MPGILPQGEVAREQRGANHEANRRNEPNSAVQKAARQQSNHRKYGSCMKQQHGAGGGKPACICTVGGGCGQRDAGGAHQAGKPNQQAVRHDHEVRSSSSFAIAARNSAMPVALLDEVASTFGNAAGCFANAASVSAMRDCSSEAFTWSALVSTIW